MVSPLRSNDADKSGSRKTNSIQFGTMKLSLEKIGPGGKFKIVKEKAPLPKLSLVPVPHLWIAPASLLSVDLLFKRNPQASPSPPGHSGNFSFPLLV